MARSPVAVVASDWHLAPGAWKRNPAIAGDAYHGLNQAVDYCLQRQVPMIAPGDLFDVQHPDAFSLYAARMALDRMARANLDLYHVQGQHEYQHPVPVLNAIHSGPVHVNRTVFRVGPLRCVGLDYMNPDALRAEFATAGRREGADVLVTHQVWKNLVPWRQNAPTFEEIPYGYTVSGDFHHHGLWHYHGPGGEGVFMSPGTLCMQALDEPPEKFVYLLYDDLTCESLPLTSRPFHGVVLETPEDLEKLVAEAARVCYHPPDTHPTIQRPIVRVRYADHLPEAASRLEAALAPAHAFLEAFKLEAAQAVPEHPSPMGDQALVTCLSRLRDPSTPAYRDVIRLLDAADVPAEIAAIVSTFQVAENGHAP